jgi:hypothetical protein
MAEPLPTDVSIQAVTMYPTARPYLSFVNLQPTQGVLPATGPQLEPALLDPASIPGILHPLFMSERRADHEKLRELIINNNIAHVTMPSLSQFEHLTFLLTLCPSLTGLTIECPKLESAGVRGMKKKVHPFVDFINFFPDATTLTCLELIDCSPFTVALRDSLRNSSSIKELIIRKRATERMHGSKMEHIGEMLGGIEKIQMHNCATSFGSTISKGFFEAANCQENYRK